MESNSQTGCMFSSHQLFSFAHGRATHKLNKCQAILISDSDPLKYWRPGATHTLHIKFQIFSSVVLICSNTGEWLTRWIYVFSQWSLSAQTLESDSLAGCMFNHSCQCFWSAQTLQTNSHAGCVQPFLLAVLICWYARVTHMLDVCVQPFSSVVLISSNTEEVSSSDSHAGCVFSHSC